MILNHNTPLDCLLEFLKEEKKKIHKSLIILSDSIIDIDPISYINIALLQSI